MRFLSEKQKDTRNVVTAIVLISFQLFFGLRGYIYTDCFQYIDCFEDIESYLPSIGQPNARYESAYVVLNYVISWFTDNYFVFLFLWTLIDVVLIHLIFKKECPRYYLLAFALLLPFWTGVQMNLFRNEKAILIFFLSLSYIREKKIAKFLLVMSLDFFFHSTALFYVPLYFLLQIRNRKVWTVISFVSLAFYFVGMSGTFDQVNQIATLISYRYAEKASSYTEQAVNAGFTFGFIFRLVLLFIHLYYYNRLIKLNYVVVHLSLLYLNFNMAFNSVLVFRDRFTVLVVLGLVCTLPYVFCYLKQECSIRSLKRRHIISKTITMASEVSCFIRLRAYVALGFFTFIQLGSIAYLYVQTNNPAAQYENVLTGISDRQRAEIRIFNAAADAEDR